MTEEQEKLANETKLVVHGEADAETSGAEPASENDEEDWEAEDIPLLEPGATIARHYEVLEILGRGGSSVVYKAKHNIMHKIVAVKVLLPDRRPDSRVVKRFQQEARAVSKLEHPNILKVNEFGLDENGQPYLIMDYVDGLPLSSIVKNAGTMPKDRVLNLVSQIAQALSHAHAQGIVHRDLKPSNIIVVNKDGSESVRIVDFGIAKINAPEMSGNTLTQTGEIFGSPLYMSPEQCLGKPVDGRSDLYSLGCVMFECLTGHPPYQAASHLETLMQHVQGDPPEFPKTFDPVLQAFIMKAIAKNPDNRFQTADDFLNGLINWQGGSGARSTPPPLPVLGGSDIHRNDSRQSFLKRPGMLPAIGLIVLLVVIFTYSLASMPSGNSAIEEARQETVKFSTDYGVWYQYASLLGDANQPAKAEGAYRKVTELNPKYAEGWDGLGWALNEQGKLSEAEFAYRKATEIEPNWFDGWYGLGCVLNSQGQFKKAQDAFRDAIKADPQNADGYYALGDALESDGHNAEAIKAFRDALKLKPDYSDVWNRLATLLAKTGDTAGSREAWSHVR